MQSTNVSETISNQLAGWTLAARYEDFSVADLTAIKHCILDQLGAQLVGSTLSYNRLVYDHAQEIGRNGPCTIVGTDTRMANLEAAFVNATFGQGCEIDDFGHSGAATIPIAVAMGEEAGIGGRELLTLVGVGYELFYRLHDAVMPQMLQRGFHQQAVLGVFTSAAIAGRVMRLNREQLSHALAIAGSHACGIAEYDQSGGEVKRMHAGLGARGGIQAAMLARRGLTGPGRVFEGSRGILRTFVDKVTDEAAITADIGQRLIFRPRIAFKVYPTVGTIQTAIDAMTILVKEHDLKPTQVAEIRVGMREYALHHGGGITVPEDVVGAQFSLSYSLALSVATRSNHLRNYVDASLWRNPEIVTLIGKVQGYVDNDAVEDRNYGSRITVVTTDGRRLENYQPYRRGASKHPFTQTDVEDKFRSLADGVIAPERAEQMIAMVNDLENLPDIGAMTALLRV